MLRKVIEFIFGPLKFATQARRYVASQTVHKTWSYRNANGRSNKEEIETNKV